MCLFFSSMLNTADQHNVQKTAKLFVSRFLEIFHLNSYAIFFSYLISKVLWRSI